MTDQIKDEKEFREFYQDYLEGQSDLSDLYQQSETVQPSEKIDQTILNAAKKQSNKSQLVHFPTGRHSRYYSLAAGIAVFSLVGLLVFKTWETEQKHLQPEFSVESTAPTEADYIPSAAESRLGTSIKTNSSAARDDLLEKEQAYKSPPKEEEAIRPAPAPAALALEYQATRKISPAMMRSKATALPQKNKKQSPQKMMDREIQSISAQDWLKKIQELISTDKRQQAKEELALFIQAYPDYPVDNELIKAIEVQEKIK